MACSLTPSLVARHRNPVHLLVHAHVYPRLASTLTCPYLRTLCHSVYSRVYDHFEERQHLEDGPKLCPHAARRHQGKAKPQPQVLLKRLASLASSISRL